jgi:DNA-binding NtrC family response regulator
MVKATILLADNDPDFLQTRGEFLRRAGYRLLTAASPAEASGFLEREDIDLALLDIRLRDDDDEKDTSGLVLAEEEARSVPKIILTGFPSHDYVREALRPRLDGLSAAADFLAKRDGPGAMLAAVERVLQG